jgi:hypothetical protein
VEAGCGVVNGRVVKLVVVLVGFTPGGAEVNVEVIYTHSLARNAYNAAQNSDYTQHQLIQLIELITII